MVDPGSDLPEAVSRRLSGPAWSSALSISDFASCLATGMEPAGFVQGYAVMQWSWYSNYSSMGITGRGYPNLMTGQDQYVEQWRCPHGFVGTEHRMYGINYEQTWVEDNWTRGW